MDTRLKISYERERRPFYIWCEWHCENCEEKHKARFNVLVQTRVAKTKIMTDCWYDQETDIGIRDIAYNKVIRPKRKGASTGSKLYCSGQTTMKEIFKVLAKYLEDFYEIEPHTLKMTICHTY